MVTPSPAVGWDPQRGFRGFFATFESVYRENRTPSGMMANRGAQPLGVPSFSTSSPRPPRLHVKIDFGVRGCGNPRRAVLEASRSRKRRGIGPEKRAFIGVPWRNLGIDRGAEKSARVAAFVAEITSQVTFLSQGRHRTETFAAPLRI